MGQKEHNSLMPNDRVTTSTDTGKGSRPVYTCIVVYGWSRDVKITLASTDTLTGGGGRPVHLDVLASMNGPVMPE